MTSFPQRILGNSGQKISAIGFGCMSIASGVYGRDDKESLEVLNRSIDLGCTFWDTADIYGDTVGENEQYISQVLKKRRSEVFICTKFGIDLSNGFLGLKGVGTPEYVRKSCENSLARLGVETIDLYYQHRMDFSVPIEETVKAMAELVKEGKVRYLGLSECSAATLRRAHKVHPIAAVQVEYSPWSLEIEENGLLDACKELGVAIVAYSPLGRGFLTGAYKSYDDLPQGNDYRRILPRFQPDVFAKNLELVDFFEGIAKRKGVKASQIVLAWVLAQGPQFIPIPGTKRVKYLEENIESVNVKLSEEELKEIREAVNKTNIVGDRADQLLMTTIDRRTN